MCKPQIDWAGVEKEVRRRWHSLTPFRLGLIVGELGLALEPPVGKSDRWHALYQQGISGGIETAERRSAQQEPATITAPQKTPKLIVEHGIPIPPRRSGKPVIWGAPKYPWERMKEGDSFFVPGSGLADQQGRLNTAACKRARTNPGEHYVTRAEEGAGIRVWRVSTEVAEKNRARDTHPKDGDRETGLRS